MPDDRVANLEARNRSHRREQLAAAADVERELGAIGARERRSHSLRNE